MKVKLLSAIMVFPSFIACAIPEVSDINWDQSSGAKKTRLSYTLSEAPAILQVDVQTNANRSLDHTDPGWVSIGTQNFAHFPGVNGILVEEAGLHTSVWDATSDWPGYKRLVARVQVTVWPTNAAAWADNTEFWERVQAEKDAAEEAEDLKKHPLYMVVDLETSGQVNYYTSEDELPEGIGSDIYRTTKMVFRKVRAKNKTACLGSPAKEVGRYTAGNPEEQRYVKFSHDYYLGVFEVTQKQFSLIYGSNPSTFKGGEESVWGTRPVEDVQFTYYNEQQMKNDAYLRDPDNWPPASTDEEESAHLVTSERAFIKLFRDKTGLGTELDLPTHSQWEFACRAGTSSALYSGEDLTSADLTSDHTELNSLARYYANSAASSSPTEATATTTETATARVGSYTPNAWGFYDMLGNVAEHCLDYYNKPAANTADTAYLDYPGEATYADNKTSGSAAYTMHIVAGGSWKTTTATMGLRAAARSAIKFSDEMAGFRLCINVPND